MLFTTSKENLNLAVSAVLRAINPKSIIPLYSCVKIEVKSDLAIFTGAGLDLSIECSIPVQAEKEGVTLVPAKYLGDIVRRLPDIPITLEHTESMEMTIRYEKSIFTLRTMSPEDFPVPDIFGGGLDFTVSADVLKKLIRQSSFAASADDLKGIFTGILWELEGDELSLIGSDTHRLAWVKGPANNNISDAQGSFIIPARIASEISRLILEDHCHIKVDKNTVFFTFDNIKLNCRILEGGFPNFRQVIPKNFITNVRIESKSLRDATERISLFTASNDSSSTIHLEIEENTLSIHSQSDIGFGREEFIIEKSGEDIKISFNSRYITDVFKVTDGDTVNIQFSGQTSAGVIKEVGDESFLYLILPVKI